MCAVYYENPFGNPARPLESKLKIVNTTHDEQTIKVTEDIAEVAAKFVKEKMEEAERKFLKGINAVVDIKISDSWVK
jgi:DNA polymerase I-like protein with 3'-5' exonuclease and polymerase domains